MRKILIVGLFIISGIAFGNDDFDYQIEDIQIEMAKIKPTPYEKKHFPQCFPSFVTPNVSTLSMLLHRIWFNNDDFIYRVNTKDKVVALTFDDGPSYQKDFMPAVLDILKMHNVPGTFYVLGSRIQKSKEKRMLKRLYEEGHEIQLHGWDQTKSITKYSNGEILNDIARLKSTINNALGFSLGEDYPWNFRPAFGISNKRTTNLLKDNGYPVVITTGIYGQFNFLNWKSFEPTNYVVATTLKTVKPGAILTYHVGYEEGRSERIWDSPCTALSLKRIIPELKSRGYRFLKLSDLLSRN